MSDSFYINYKVFVIEGFISFTFQTQSLILPSFLNFFIKIKLFEEKGIHYIILASYPLTFFYVYIDNDHLNKN